MSRERELEDEIARIAAELASMPLSNALRDRRLALNRARERHDAELSRVRATRALEERLASVTLELSEPSLAEPVQRRLRRELRTLESELLELRTSPASGSVAQE